MARESRIAEIYRSELKNKGLLGALFSSLSERKKEKTDIRRLLPQSGLTGAAFGKIFGKAYRYNDRPRSSIGATRNVDSSIGNGMSQSGMSPEVNEKLTRISTDTRITAKNTIVLPAMARDMNLTRMNMQKLVKLSGGKATRNTDIGWKNKDAREIQYKGQLKQNTDAENKSIPKKTMGKTGVLGKIGSIGGSILGGIGSIGGSILGGIGSIGSGLIGLAGSILGGIGSLIGGAASGIFSILGGVLSAAGPWGIILGAGAGFLIYQIFKSFDFEEMGKQFGGIYDDISKSIKSFLGIKEGEIESKGMFQTLAERLDKTFDTKMFTDGMKKFNEGMEKLNIIMTKSFEYLTDIVAATIKDFTNHAINFYKQHEEAILMAIAIGGGAGIGGVKGGAVAGTAMAAYLLVKGGQGIEDKENLIKTKEANLTRRLSTYAPEGVINNQADMNTAIENMKEIAIGSMLPIKGKSQDDAKADLEIFNSELINIEEQRRLLKILKDKKKPLPTNNLSQVRPLAERLSEAPASSTTSTPATESGPSKDILSKKFSDLSEPEKTMFLEAQAKAEGFAPGSLSYKNNNPGNMELTKKNAAWIKSLGGVEGEGSKTHRFAKFANLEAGYAAMRRNWESEQYRDITVKEGLKLWVGKNDDSNQYINNIASIINREKSSQGDVRKSEPPPIANDNAKPAPTSQPVPATPATSSKLTGDALAAASVGAVSTVASAAPTIVNAPVTNNMSSGGGGNLATANVYDTELAKKFFNSSIFA